ncbi:hypothetical protein [Haloflavibacter putidus]|uniref:t-SNARE coiled-coil homology domain-containing protein n=1 Tax=Haloflavibacter putidus TaxID=2576776 RepID=A0A507ZW31_9FLAO|nr:hypothetical protein [Haloflavibacter putidus]TQD38985.1 hypothetical protein FKR84_06180 [Haloflavibacter putidus]
MNNPEIQSSLIDIENNLKNLQSAREQVLSIIDSSEQLIKSVQKSTSSIEMLTDKVDVKNSNISTEIDRLSYNLKSEFETILNRLETDSNKVSNEFEIKANETLKGLKSLNEHISNTEEKLAAFDFFKSFGILSSEISELKHEIVNSFSEQEKLISKLENKIFSELSKINEGFGIGFNEQSEKLDGIYENEKDIAKKVSEVESKFIDKIDYLIKVQKRFFYITIILIALSLVIILLQFGFKWSF